MVSFLMEAIFLLCPFTVSLLSAYLSGVLITSCLLYLHGLKTPYTLQMPSHKILGLLWMPERSHAHLAYSKKMWRTYVISGCAKCHWDSCLFAGRVKGKNWIQEWGPQRHVVSPKSVEDLSRRSQEGEGLVSLSIRKFTDIVPIGYWGYHWISL